MPIRPEEKHDGCSGILNARISNNGFFQGVDLGSWNVRGVMPKLIDIEVALVRKKLTFAVMKNKKQTL